jgi:pilus assembly protein Flp/PilA
MLSYVAYVATFVVARLRRDDRGVTAVEYGLILALIAGVIIAGLLLLGPALNNLFTNSANCVNAPSGCPGGP